MTSIAGLCILPCFECNQPIIVFFGRCLALDSDFFLWSISRKKQAVIKLITAIMEELLENIFGGKSGPIKPEEVINFNRELGELDDPNKFGQVFGRPRD